MTQASVVGDLLRDLEAEHDALDRLLAGMPDSAWTTPTPASGWNVADTISHLTFFDEQATIAITDPERFEHEKSRLIEASLAGAVPDVELGRRLEGEPSALHQSWRSSRRAFLDSARHRGEEEPKARIPWYGPPMSLASFTTARLMETWAHGQDVRDALGEEAEVSPRLKHVIYLGVTARPFAFAVHGVADPGDAIRVEAAAPDGSVWAWGPPDATNRVTGGALDLALVLTQRRHRARTGVVVEGETANLWLDIAQAFAGPPTTTAADR